MPILHQDEHLLAVAKPTGVTVIPERDAKPGSDLHAQLQAQHGERLWVVHRLDRDTSGVLLFARDADTHRALNQLFEARAVAKTYWAIAAGASLPDAGSIDRALHPARKGRMRPALPGEAGALAARTEFTTLARWPLPNAQTASELELRPHTGRQHQLRVHLRALGAPLAGDPLYRLPEGQRPLWPVDPPRLVLHAACIAFDHPTSRSPLVITAPLPDDLLAFRAALAAARAGA